MTEPRIATSFDATSTAAEVAAGIDLTGRVAVVTGASSGIGVETARALAAAGARVVLAVRDPSAGRTVADDIGRSTGGDVVVAPLDLADPGSVEAFVADWEGPLGILVNNAGVMMTPETYTRQGWELQFATNHLGHFGLALGLHDALVADGAARVVSVSSSGHAGSPVVFDDLFFDRRAYDPGLAYGQSKTANVLFAVEATRRWATDGITVNAVMPGGIFTNLQRHWDPEVLASTKRAAAGLAKTPEQGAATSVLVATAPALEGVGGRYFEDCREAEVVDEITDGLHGVVPHALDPVAAERLWDVSLELWERARG
ncbi:oxidoreductase, short chain dehydrogenase/reductase family protein [Aeromicrobium marinum DSM 15272]|uniref:Probable oxidoreductase n=1 Tax=Aeromicrobium marinum DSM 15272 TaxID=585531 RepID=E2SCI5_9ACTN|nr:SDR family NAD(P)-dependent oxidoreductase [Aeromicrobium marinum]EFQ82938.1 oxidoreductase, short chain dehydrogenase/reductase family protein [Aeromicrobium marinum DSM 15272]